MWSHVHILYACSIIVYDILILVVYYYNFYSKIHYIHLCVISYTISIRIYILVRVYIYIYTTSTEFSHRLCY